MKFGISGTKRTVRNGEVSVTGALAVQGVSKVRSDFFFT